ncbi:MAG: hypothetical protein PSV23_08340 [Brevundimonas sp.]|uniref:hypothetical protein n=1 Tax=Brevundimonas sp. TaxID=1871086 RepID=UPI002489C754|nr:hypothetical protein [Brevundimonas sp.]MDI1326797.1 hypothetical protein [Brevundimonas sp.]
MRWLTLGLFAVSTGCASVQAPVVLAEGEGLVRVGCAVGKDRRLTRCEILSEQPAGQGFGEAALRAAGHARIAADGLRPPGARIQYSIRFQPR